MIPFALSVLLTLGFTALSVGAYRRQACAARSKNQKKIAAWLAAATICASASTVISGISAFGDGKELMELARENAKTNSQILSATRHAAFIAEGSNDVGITIARAGSAFDVMASNAGVYPAYNVTVIPVPLKYSRGFLGEQPALSLSKLELSMPSLSRGLPLGEMAENQVIHLPIAPEKATDDQLASDFFIRTRSGVTKYMVRGRRIDGHWKQAVALVEADGTSQVAYSTDFPRSTSGEIAWY